MSADTAVFALSEKGAGLAGLISKELGASLHIFHKYFTGYGEPFDALPNLVAELFSKKKALVFVMAQGIAARATAPHLKSKYTDPAVVVIDDSARFVISALSGHEGGANELAYIVAGITGATPVVTTSTEAGRSYVMGIGTRKGVSAGDVISAVNGACEDLLITPVDLRVVASAWLKRDEQGLLEAAEALSVNLRFIPKFLFDHYSDITTPTAAANHFAIPAVAEPSAMIAAQHGRLVLPAKVYNSVMIAVAKDTLICTD